MIKIRIRFRKYGNMKFIGHLDVMRYFQKAIRRAEIHIRYSGGFSPHQIMSFAAPLGVGLTSDGEYVDIELTDDVAPSDLKERLNAQMSEGFEVTDCFLLPEDAQNAMSIVAAADYVCIPRVGSGPEDAEGFIRDLAAFFEQPQVMITKKTKRGEKEMDLKPLIYELSPRMEADGPVLFLKVSNGSAANVKPELVLDAYYASIGEERPPFAWMYRREEVYADQASSEEQGKGVHRFIPLGELGARIG